MSAPAGDEKPKAASPPPATASPAPAAAKKTRTKRAPATPGEKAAPAAKKAKKTEAAADGSATTTPAKKTTAKKKPKEPEEVEQAVADSEEQARRRANLEAEEQTEGDGADDDVDVNNWQTIMDDAKNMGDYQHRFTTLYQNMNPEQQERYELFRSSGITEDEFVREVLTPLGIHAQKEPMVAMRAIGKLFIGELVDRALTVMSEWGDQGPIRPIHVREAYRRIEEEGKTPYSPKTLRFGRSR